MWLLGTLLLVIGSNLVTSECPHLSPALRRWSDTAQWQNGQKPVAGDAVVISDHVLLDESPPALASLTVQSGGSLVFSPEADVTLTTDYVMLHGEMHVGSEDCRFHKKARVVLTGTHGQYNVPGFGEKFIGVGAGGKLEIHGLNKLAWAKMTETMPKMTVENGGLLYSNWEDPSMSTWTNSVRAYVINGTTGEIVFNRDCRHKGDGHRGDKDPTLLVQALDSVGEGDVIVLASQWNALGDASDMAAIYDAAERAAFGHVTGTLKMRQLQQLDAYALVAVKGGIVREELGQTLNFEGVRTAKIFAEVPVAGTSRVVTVDAFNAPHHYQHGRAYVKFAQSAKILTLTHDATTWVPGDRVLVTSTDYDFKQAEEAEVVYCSPSECDSNQVKIILTNRYLHFGEVTDGVDERAEVALLTRNVVIEGQVQHACVAGNGNCDVNKHDNFGGHIKVEAGFGAVHIEGAELRRMGQGMYPDRHPISFEQCGDVDARGGYSAPTYVRSNSIVHSFANCVVLSGTHGLLIEDNVMWEHASHCVYLREGGETRTVVDGNLVAGTRPRGDAAPLDTQASSYLITNPLTYFRNNVAAGGKRGVWYIFPQEPLGGSANKSIMQKDEARHTKWLEFSNNVAHSYDEGVRNMGSLPTVSTFSGGGHYDPLEDPLDQESDRVPFYLDRLTAYKNRYKNIWMTGGYLVVQDSSFADSHESILLSKWRGEQYVDRCVVVGESANEGEPSSFWDAVNKVSIPLPRAVPFPWNPTAPIKGVVSGEGPQYLDQVWFQGFAHNANRSAGAISFHGNAHYPSSSRNEMSGLSFGFNDNIGNTNSGVRVFDGDSSVPGYNDFDGDMQVMIRDADGSLTGSAGSTIVRNYPVFTTARCVARDNWNLAVCPHRYGKLEVKAGGAKSPLIVTRDDVDVTSAVTFPFHVYARVPVILGGDYSYILHWQNAMPKEIRLMGLGLEKDNNLRFGLCVPRDAELTLWSSNPQYRPRKELWKEVSSVRNLDNDNDEGDRYFWDKANGIIFFKMVNPRTRCPDFKDECKDGCPYMHITLVSGTATDADCRDRIQAYSRTPLSAEGALTYKALPPTPLPENVGAGEMLPYEKRPSVDGGYGAWGNWGPCTVTCGGGSQLRRRACDNPMPEHDGRPCEGDREEVRVCGTTPCAVNGGLGLWSTWSSCDALPDNGQKGLQTRERECATPQPQHGGLACSGVTEQMQACLAVPLVA